MSQSLTHAFRNATTVSKQQKCLNTLIGYFSSRRSPSLRSLSLLRLVCIIRRPRYNISIVKAISGRGLLPPTVGLDTWDCWSGADSSPSSSAGFLESGWVWSSRASASDGTAAVGIRAAEGGAGVSMGERLCRAGGIGAFVVSIAGQQ